MESIIDLLHESEAKEYGSTKKINLENAKSKKAIDAWWRKQSETEPEEPK